MSAQTGHDSETATESVQRRWLKHYDPNVPAHLTYPHIPIYKMLDDTAAKYPDRTCVIFFGKRYTYRQIQEWSSKFAAGLRVLGIRKGDKVALLLPNSPQFLIAYYGLLKVGAIIVPLNPLYTERELSFHLTDSETATVITLPMFLEKVAPLRQTTPLKRIITSKLADFLPFPLNLVQRFREGKLVSSITGGGLVDFQQVLKQPGSENFKPEANAVHGPQAKQRQTEKCLIV